MMKTPIPGQPVRGSSSGRPIMALLDLLGRRWVLRILWELRDNQLGFRELQQRCDRMSSSVLARRLQELQDVQIIAKYENDNYGLTPEGKQLVMELKGLNDWANHWAQLLDKG